MADDGERRQGRKRSKYTARACQGCKRRKVKCSGGDGCCQECWSRDMACRYSPAAKQHQHPDDGLRRQSTLHSRPHIGEQQHLGISSSSDPRVSGLCDRVAALERMLNHILKASTVVGDGPSPSTNLQTPIIRLNGTTDAADADEEEADQFAIRPTTSHDDVTLSSQVAAMSALLSKPPSPTPGGRIIKQPSKVEFLVEFPEPPDLQHLLDVYFRDMDSYFPFLHRQDTETRMYKMIRGLGYSAYNRMLVVGVDSLSTIALACMMMALAECLDPAEGARDGETKPGWERYQQGCRLMQCFSNFSRIVDLDVVRAQCLVAAYLMHCEKLCAASSAVSVTWRLAISIRLHVRRAWPSGDEAEQNLYRQKLWWTIYFLDRQISRRSGTPYHIHDTEFDVDDFTLPSDCTASNPNTQDSEKCSSSTKTYIQALINLARLWGHIWDNCFAVGAKNKGDWMELEIMDARILNTRRQLPKSLTWDSTELHNYMLGGEDAVHIRRRLQIFTRLELLRMLIRQNPMRQTNSDNRENDHLCARLSRDVITAHELFISNYPRARAISYFSTSTTVECIYHLASVMHHSEDSDERMICVSALHQAHGILVRLSAYCNAAKRALNALNGVFRKWGSVRGGRCASDDVGLQGDVGDASYALGPSPRLHDIQSDTNLQFGADSFNNLDLSEWMNVSLGNEAFDFQIDSHQL